MAECFNYANEMRIEWIKNWFFFVVIDAIMNRNKLSRPFGVDDIALARWDILLIMMVGEWIKSIDCNINNCYANAGILAACLFEKKKNDFNLFVSQLAC